MNKPKKIWFSGKILKGKLHFLCGAATFETHPLKPITKIVTTEDIVFSTTYLIDLFLKSTA